MYPIFFHEYACDSFLKETCASLHFIYVSAVLKGKHLLSGLFLLLAEHFHFIYVSPSAVLPQTVYECVCDWQFQVFVSFRFFYLFYLVFYLLLLRTKLSHPQIHLEQSVTFTVEAMASICFGLVIFITIPERTTDEHPFFVLCCFCLLFTHHQ